jgi:hypothetical protein
MKIEKKKKKNSRYRNDTEFRNFCPTGTIRVGGCCQKKNKNDEIVYFWRVIIKKRLVIVDQPNRMSDTHSPEQFRTGSCTVRRVIGIATKSVTFLSKKKNKKPPETEQNTSS